MAEVTVIQQLEQAQELMQQASELLKKADGRCGFGHLKQAINGVQDELTKADSKLRFLLIAHEQLYKKRY